MTAQAAAKSDDVPTASLAVLVQGFAVEADAIDRPVGQVRVAVDEECGGVQR
jgi:hypothetical protein